MRSTFNPDPSHLLVCELDLVSEGLLEHLEEPWRHRALGQSSRSHHCTHHVLVLWLVLDDEVFVVVVVEGFGVCPEDTTRRCHGHVAESVRKLSNERV